MYMYWRFSEKRKGTAGIEMTDMAANAPHGSTIATHMLHFVFSIHRSPSGRTSLPVVAKVHVHIIRESLARVSSITAWHGGATQF